MKKTTQRELNIAEFITQHKGSQICETEFGAMVASTRPGDFYFDNNASVSDQKPIRLTLTSSGFEDLSESDEEHVFVAKVILAIATGALAKQLCTPYPSPRWAVADQSNRYPVWVKAVEIMKLFTEPIHKDDQIQYEAIFEEYLASGRVLNPYID